MRSILRLFSSPLKLSLIGLTALICGASVWFTFMPHKPWQTWYSKSSAPQGLNIDFREDGTVRSVSFKSVFGSEAKNIGSDLLWMTEEQNILAFHLGNGRFRVQKKTDIFKDATDVFVIDLWIPAALSAIALLALIVWAPLVRYRRRRCGHCPYCDYNLRGQLEQCPECGRGGASPEELDQTVATT